MYTLTLSNSLHLMQVYKPPFLATSSFTSDILPLLTARRWCMAGGSQANWVYEDIFTTDFPGEPFQSWKKNVKWTEWQIPTDRGKGNICLPNLYLLKLFFVLQASLSFAGYRAPTKLFPLTNYLLSKGGVSVLVGLVMLRKICDFQRFLKNGFHHTGVTSHQFNQVDTMDHIWRGNLLEYRIYYYFLLMAPI